MADHTELKVKAGLKSLSLSKHIFYLNIENIPLEDVKKCNDSYTLTIKRKNNKGVKIIAQLTLFSDLYKKISHLKQPIKKNMITLTAKTKNNLQVHFEMEVSVRVIKSETRELRKISPNHRKKDLYTIEVEYYFPKEKLNKMEQEALKELQNKAVSEKSVSKEDVQKEINEKLKSRKGIKDATGSTFKQCENCHYFNRKKCTYHGVNVYTNEVCSKFYAPKIRVYSGGGFSPK